MSTPHQSLRNKYALLAAKTISWLFHPFYLPTVAVILLLVFSYLNQMPNSYRIAFAGIVIHFTWVYPLNALRM